MKIGTPEQPWINTDRFLDVERLKSLDLDIIKGICLASHDITAYGWNIVERNDFIQARRYILDELPKDDPRRQAFLELRTVRGDLNATALKLFTKLCFNTYSGGPCIVLRRPLVYALKNFAYATNDTGNVAFFPTLMQFIATLPFAEIGRVLIFLTDHDLVTPLHQDDSETPHKNEFLWFRSNLHKRFFVYENQQKHHIDSHSAFFNEHHWHGTDPLPQMCFSIRVDGVFTEQFRAQLGLTEATSYE